MRNLILSLAVLMTAACSLAQSETMFFSVDVAATAGYAPWRSFGDFRKAYNSSNDTALTRGLGSLSTQYGFEIGGDFFVSNHLISAVDFSKTYGKAKAEFNNGAQRIIRSDINSITASIGWLQETGKGYWAISSGFNFGFGVVKSYLRFADGTKYVSTGGLSGVFHDVAVAVPLKIELARNLSERIMLKFALQGNYYFLHLDDGMQNVFITGGESTLTLNGNAVKFDASAVFFSTGLTFKIFSE